MAGAPFRLCPTRSCGSGSAEEKAKRLNFLRQKIAGIESFGIARADTARMTDTGLAGTALTSTALTSTALAPLAPAGAARVPLGAARLDAVLAGGLAAGALHEITAAAPGDAAAAAGFALALGARLAASRAAPLFWISENFAGREHGALYGPGVALYGLDPGRLVLVRAANAQDALWAMEEALKCRPASVVISEIFSAKLYDLTAARRLSLAAQTHGTTGLVFFAGPVQAAALSSSAVTRFEVGARPSPQLGSAAGRMPLPGLAAFGVRIAKARAGPSGFPFDRDTIHPILWSPREVLFRDAVSLALSAVVGDGPDHPARRQSA